MFIDTSYLFEVENEPGKSPSIRDIAQFVCNVNLPVNRTHDAVQDARIAMQSVHYLVHTYQQQQPPGRMFGVQEFVQLMSTVPIVPRLVNGLQHPAAQCLLVHRIPSAYTVEDIKTMFATCSYVLPQLVQPISFSGHSEEEDKTAGNGKTTVVFSSEGHANLAFDSLSGPNRPDKHNKAQKRVYVKSGGHICVRKY